MYAWTWAWRDSRAATAADGGDGEAGREEGQKKALECQRRKERSELISGSFHVVFSAIRNQARM